MVPNTKLPARSVRPSFSRVVGRSASTSTSGVKASASGVAPSTSARKSPFSIPSSSAPDSHSANEPSRAGSVQRRVPPPSNIHRLALSMSVHSSHRRRGHHTMPSPSVQRQSTTSVAVSLMDSLRAIGAADVDVHGVRRTPHPDEPWIAAHLAVLHEAVVDILLDLDLHLLAAIRADDWK